MKYTKNIFFSLLTTISLIIPIIAITPAAHAAQDPKHASDGRAPSQNTSSPTKPHNWHNSHGPQKTMPLQNQYHTPECCCAHQPPYSSYPGYHPRAPQQAGAQTGNVNIHFTAANSSDQTAMQHAHLEQLQHQEQWQNQHQEVETVTVVSLAKDCESFLGNYKWTLMFGFLCAGYAMMCKRIKDDQDFLCRGKNWANWRAYDGQRMESCLAADIQYRYFNPQDPANYAAALAECALDLEHEEQRYSRIMRLYKWLKKWYLYLLFPMSEEDLQNVREARERFEAMRRIYLRLVASRNPYISNLPSSNLSSYNQPAYNQATYNELPCTLPCCNPVK